jgi:hypothetical protein
LDRAVLISVTVSQSLDDSRGGAAPDEGQDAHLAAGRPDFLATDHVVGLVVAALDQDVGQEAAMRSRGVSSSNGVTASTQARPART